MSEIKRKELYTWRDELLAALCYGFLGSLLTVALMAWWFL